MSLSQVGEVKTELRDPRSVRAAGRAPAWITPLVRALLVVSDAVLAVAAIVLAYKIREGTPLLKGTGNLFAFSREFAPYGALLFFIVPVRVLVSSYYDLYRIRGQFSFVEEGIRVFKAAWFGSLIIVAITFLYRGGYAFRTFSYARGVFILDALLFFLFLLVLRVFVRLTQVAVRQRGINLIPTIVVGRSTEAGHFIREVAERPALGYKIIGVVDTGPVLGTAGAALFEGVPVIGEFRDLPATVRESGANEVVITDPDIPGDALFAAMMRIGRMRGVEFRIAPNLFNCLPRKTEIDQIGALPVITLFREPLTRGSRILKRAIDCVCSALAIAILSPLWLIVALLVRLDSRGPVFYKQERVGMDGRVFLFYKFRSMHVNTDDAAHREYQERFIKGSSDANLGDQDKPVYKLPADKRITRVGRFLRRSSLDEFPQLLNVLRGDMSLVGPRPPIPYEVEAYELWHRKRLDMKPGLTGLWQVSGRNRLTFDEMVRLDIFYIENWSLLLDLKIILKTLPELIRGDAY